MRLCYIANANSIHTRRWVAPFVQRGDEVHVLSYMRVTRPWPEVALVDLTQLPGPPRGKRYYWAYWLRNYLHRTRPDILHAHQVTIAGWLGALTGYHPFVISAWGSDLLLEPKRSRWRRWKTRFALNHCDALTAPSPFLVEAALRLDAPRERVHLIPWGVETDVFTPIPDDRLATRRRFGIAPEAKVIFSPRGLKPVYNHDILIQAAAQIASDSSSVHLCFLDFNVDPDYKDALHQQLSDAGLTSYVHWLPPQPDMAAMARLYRMADAVASIPSSEGYGFSVYEALACGVPTLITDLPIFQHVLTNGRHVLKTPVRDVATTAQALQRLLADTALRARLRRNGLALVQNLSVARRIHLTKALYSNLLAFP